MSDTLFPNPRQPFARSLDRHFAALRKTLGDSSREHVHSPRRDKATSGAGVAGKKLPCQPQAGIHP